MTEHTSKQIAAMRMQNTGLETSFNKKSTEYTKQDVDASQFTTPEAELEALQTYNTYLKDISKRTRPPPAVKETKVAVSVAATPATPTTGKDKDEDDYEDKKRVFHKFTDMTEMKRAYFSTEPDSGEQFTKLLDEHPFLYYKAIYNADDFMGRPDYVAKNLVRGFVRNLEEVSPYMMVKFQCFAAVTTKQVHTNEGVIDVPEVGQTRYKYASYWIINSTDPLPDILGSMHEDFDFEQISRSEMEEAWSKDESKRETGAENGQLIFEMYLH